jgi:methionyl-tRNA formyltransferase
MRIAFIGTVQFSRRALEHVLTLADAEVVGVVARSASPFNADFSPLAPIAREHGIPCALADDLAPDELAPWLAQRQPEVVYCFGWSSLLKRDVLDVPSLGVIGFHPAELPHNRGRHPLIWALALGLERTAATFFYMDEGADSGDILSQRSVSIDQTDDAASLYEKVTTVALAQISEFTAQLAHGRAPRTPQDQARAHYWRKRDAQDGRVDWRMSSVSIYNLVRALTHPYVGADFTLNGQAVKLWRVAPVEEAPDNYEPGRVLGLRERELVVKTGDGAIRLIDHEIDVLPPVGSYLR